MATDSSQPKLRNVDARPFTHQGRPFFLLRDPSGISEQAVMVPQELGPALALCDGTRDMRTLAAGLALRYGLRVPTETLRQLIEILDEAYLLDNERYRQARREAVDAYRMAPFRPPTLAGESYPGSADDLRELLQAYVNAVEDGTPPAAGGRGLISPHIDYQRGGMVYAATWARAAERVREADLAIILGTDHSGDGNDLTLTRQSYATPFGILPTPQDAVDAVAAAVGEDAAFSGELHHRGEHSIELAAVWLHFIRGGEPCDVLPVLCGPLARFVNDEADPGTDPLLTGAVDALAGLAAGRRTVVVAAADLAHVGPAFGGEPLDDAARALLRDVDEELVGYVCEGDAAGFLGAIRDVRNGNNVCGVSPIYLALRILGETRGEPVAYACCPADGENTSAVTVAGVVLE